MPLILPGNVASAVSGAYEVANSCRFNDGDNPYMHKTPGGAGNVDTWTFSCWLKRSTISAAQRIFSQGDHSDGNPMTFLGFQSDDTLIFNNYQGSDEALVTNRLFRDVAAWYNIILRCDTTNGTAGDRYRLYINGTEETSFSTDNNPSVNADTSVNSTNKFELGSVGATTQNFDGYMAEVCLVDGSSLAPTSFGEFDEDSPTIWKPIDVSGLTFGTNGFYLDFEASDNLGNDANGGTDLTEVNLAAIDQCVDTPTNNFCTLNPLIRTPNPPAFSEGNTRYYKSSTGAGHGPHSLSTMAVASGKWYFELKSVSETSFNVGMISDNFVNADSNGNFGSSNKYVIVPDSTFGDNKTVGSTTTAISFSYSANDIFGFAYDFDNGKFYFHINGTYFDSGDPESGSTGTGSLGDIALGTYSYIPWGGAGSYNHVHDLLWNFGNPPFSISSGNADGNGYGSFEYSVPSGYFSLCTKNLAEYG